MWRIQGYQFDCGMIVELRTPFIKLHMFINFINYL